MGGWTFCVGVPLLVLIEGSGFGVENCEELVPVFLDVFKAGDCGGGVFVGILEGVYGVFDG